MSKHETLPAPSTDVQFDGNPIDLDRVLAHVSLRFLLNANAFSTESQKSAYLLAHFRGAALDWVGQLLAGNASYLDDYNGLLSVVKSSFYHNRDQIQASAQTEIAALRQTGDLLEFLTKFDYLAARAGLNSDCSKITLLLPKLNKTYQDAVTKNGQNYMVYGIMRTALLNVYSRDVQAKVDPDKRREKSRCKKCGKRGHTGTQCKATN